MARKGSYQNNPQLQHSVDQVIKVATRCIMQDVQGDIHYVLIVRNPNVPIWPAP
jgi:hypothetical protein